MHILYAPGDELDVLDLGHGGYAVHHGVGEGSVGLNPLSELGADVPRHLQHYVLDLLMTTMVCGVNG